MPNDVRLTTATALRRSPFLPPFEFIALLRQGLIHSVRDGRSPHTHLFLHSNKQDDRRTLASCKPFYRLTCIEKACLRDRSQPSAHCAHSPYGSLTPFTVRSGPLSKASK
jgi:hypothetical protein